MQRGKPWTVNKSEDVRQQRRWPCCVIQLVDYWLVRGGGVLVQSAAGFRRWSLASLTDCGRSTSLTAVSRRVTSAGRCCPVSVHWAGAGRWPWPCRWPLCSADATLSSLTDVCTEPGCAERPPSSTLITNPSPLRVSLPWQRDAQPT